MNWIFLIIAGLFEVGWAVGLKYTEGFTKVYPTIFTVTGMLASFYFLSMALKTLPLCYLDWDWGNWDGNFRYSVI